jgi:hypothetical protein
MYYLQISTGSVIHNHWHTEYWLFKDKGQRDLVAEAKPGAYATKKPKPGTVAKVFSHAESCRSTIRLINKGIFVVF